MYANCLPASMLLLLSVGLDAVGQDAAQAIGDLSQARIQLDSNLKSGYALGTLRNESTLDGRTETSERDIQVFYDAPKYRLDITEVRSQSADTRVESSSQVVIFDGEFLFKVASEADTSETGKAAKYRGNIYFDFKQQSILGKAGYPFRPPLHLWTELLEPDKLDPSKLVVQELASGGKVLTENRFGYSTRYYFFDDFNFDLRRVTLTSADATKPFREIALYWDEQESTRYVRRYALKEWGSSSSGTRVSKLEVEFATVKPNASIDPALFTLQGLDLPKDTPFDDYRSNVDGKPAKRKWDGGKLTTTK